MANCAVIGLLLSLLSVPVTWDDVLTAWQQNRLAASTLRVEWQLQESETDHLHRYWVSLAESKEEFAKSQSNLTESAKGGLRRTAVELRASAGRRRLERATELDFWTDRENFQFRGAPHGPINDGKQRVEFPDVEASRSNLPSHFSRVSVLSFGRATKLLFRRWDGAKVGDLSGAAVARGYPSSEIKFPPLGRSDNSWIGEQHAIDAFFADGAMESQILGSVVYTGRTCVVVGRKWPPPADNPGIKDPTILVAWIDLERGALPLRIEKYAFLPEKYGWGVREGLLPSEGESLPSPQLIVKHVELHEVTSGYWYPVRGIEQSLGPDQAPTVSRSVQRFLPHSSVEWKVVRVEPDKAMSTENFSLEFPDKTVFVNDPTGDLRVTSDLAGFSERLVKQAVKRSESAGSLRNYYLFGVLGLCGVIVVVWFRKRRRSI